MINTTNTSLHQRPKALDIVGVDIPTNILFIVVINPQVLNPEPSDMVVGRKCVGIKRSVPVNFINHEWDEGMPFNIGDDLRHDLAIALDCTENFRLALCATTTFALSRSTNIGFINLDLARKMVKIITQQRTDLFEHTPCRLISYPCFTLDLFSRDTASSGTHQINGMKPQFQRCSRFFKYSAYRWMKMMSAVIATIRRTANNFMMLCNPSAFNAENTIGIEVIFEPF